MTAPAAISRRHQVRPVPGLLARRRSGLIALADLIVFVVAWQALCVSGAVDRVFFPAPTEVLTALRDMATDGRLGDAVTASAKNWAFGYVLGVAAGVLVGLVAGSVHSVNKLLMPLLWSLWATPLIALQPLLTVWFGYDSGPIIVLVFLSTVIPVALNTVAGATGVSGSLLRAGRVYGGGRLALYLKVRLPWTLPYIVGGARLAVPTSLIGLLIGEMVGAPSGVGSIVTVATSKFQTPDAFAAILLYVVASVIAVRLLDLAERRLGRWR